jgi:hypothetical protein
MVDGCDPLFTDQPQGRLEEEGPASVAASLTALSGICRNRTFSQCGH